VYTEWKETSGPLGTRAVNLLAFMFVCLFFPKLKGFFESLFLSLLEVLRREYYSVRCPDKS
jgi:hypothetical protein